MQWSLLCWAYSEPHCCGAVRLVLRDTGTTVLLKSEVLGGAEPGQTLVLHSTCVGLGCTLKKTKNCKYGKVSAVIASSWKMFVAKSSVKCLISVFWAVSALDNCAAQTPLVQAWADYGDVHRTKLQQVSWRSNVCTSIRKQLLSPEGIV